MTTHVYNAMIWAKIETGGDKHAEILESVQGILRPIHCSNQRQFAYLMHNKGYFEKYETMPRHCYFFAPTTRTRQSAQRKRLSAFTNHSSILLLLVQTHRRAYSLIPHTSIPNRIADADPTRASGPLRIVINARKSESDRQIPTP